MCLFCGDNGVTWLSVGKKLLVPRGGGIERLRVETTIFILSGIQVLFVFKAFC
jgi:hypothetical protein